MSALATICHQIERYILTSNPASRFEMLYVTVIDRKPDNRNEILYFFLHWNRKPDNSNVKLL